MSYVQMVFDEIDFGGGERATPTPRLVGGILEDLSRHVFKFKDFEKGGFTDMTAKMWLDRLEDPKVELAFHAGISAQRGFLTTSGDYDVFANYVRWRIQKAYREGRVRYEGQPRNTKNKKGGEE